MTGQSDSSPSGRRARHRVARAAGLIAGAALALLALAACAVSTGGSGSTTERATASGSPSGSASRSVSVSSSSATPPPSTSATSSSASGSASTSPVDSRCHTSELAVSPGQSQGAAGTLYTTVLFTNTSSRTCTLYGYPGVEFLDAAGAPVRQPATRTGPTPTTVPMAPGAIAHFVVSNSDVVPQAGCPTTATATTMQIIPPDETAHLLLAAPSGGSFTVCDPRVQAVAPGTGG